MTSIYFLLTISPLNHTVRSWEWRKLSAAKEGDDCYVNSPCQHLRKCMENSMENMHTDIAYNVKALLTSLFLLFFSTLFLQQKVNNVFFLFFQQSSTSAPGTAFSWLAHVNQSGPKKTSTFIMVLYRTALVEWTVHIIKPINKLLMLDTQLLYSHLTSANSQALTSNISFSVHTLERGPTSLKISILLSYSSPSKKPSLISLETAAPIFSDGFSMRGGIIFV